MREDYGWSAIEPWLRSVLEQNGVGEPAWQAIRKAAWLAESGISYVTPDAIEALPDDAFESLIDKRIGEGGDGASRPEAVRIARRDLAVSVRRLLSEEGARQMKVLEPGEPLSEMPPMRYAVPAEGAMGDETAAAFLDRFADDLEPDPWEGPAGDDQADGLAVDFSDLDDGHDSGRQQDSTPAMVSDPDPGAATDPSLNSTRRGRSGSGGHAAPSHY